MGAADMKFNKRKNGKKPDPVDGIQFDSDREVQVYLDQLRPLARSKAITQLQVHPKFTFIVNDVVIGSYKPDFTFVDEGGVYGAKGLLRCWDVKGWSKSKKTGRMLPRTEVGFGKTKKLMRACFALEVELV